MSRGKFTYCLKAKITRSISNRGTVYLAQGQPERAIEDFSKAIELDSHYADPYSNRGAVEHKLGRDEAALKDLDTALRLNPNSADAYDSLADAYLKDRQLLAAKSAEDHSVQLARQWANPNLIRFEQKAKKLEQQFQEQEMEKKKSGKNP